MENKGELVEKLLCMACLGVGRALQPVADPRIQEYYLNILNEVPLFNVPQACPSICWECTALLRKAITFREQVKDCYRILQTYTSENLNECLLSDITRPPRLKIQLGETIVIRSDDADGLKLVNDECDDKDKTRDIQMVVVKDELKVEWSDNPDLQVNPGLPSDDERPPSHCSDNIEALDTEIETELKKFLSKKEKKYKKKIAVEKGKRREGKVSPAKKIVKKLKTENKQTKTTKSEAGQKIITIELSYEEMLAEREKESEREHYVNSKYKCATCIMGFKYEKSYNTHMENRHNSSLGNYSCPICSTIIPSVDSFTTHYKRHMRRYECSVCHKRTMDHKVMQQHYYATHENTPKEYTCNLCGKISNSLDNHRYHRDTHKARVQCGECDKTFSHRAGLMNHRLAIHELHNEFPCTRCDKVFRWKTSLKRHIEKHDAKEKPAVAAYCSGCDIPFASPSGLQRHLRTSLKHVAPHQLRLICDHCNRRFADKTKLRDHIEEKHLHKTYNCSVCLKAFKNRVGMDQHVRNVHKRRPHNKMCHHCGKGFPTKMQLESHIRTHTGERPFICEFCPTTFSQQSNLYKHNRQVHLNIKSKKHPPSKQQEPTPPPPAPPAPLRPLHYAAPFVM